MSLRLERIILRELRLPLRERFEISSGGVQERRVLLVQVHAKGGGEGWGECVAAETPHYSYETVDTAWLALRQWLAPRLLGRGLQSPATVPPLLETGVRGHSMAKAALEMAVWELAARLAGQPLAGLLGGERRQVATGISLGLQSSPAVLVERARRAREEGYGKIKMKIKPGKDLEYLRAVRAEVGSEAVLAVDANAAYSLDDLPVLQQLDALGLLMIEQPLAWDDIGQHAVLQRRLRTAICLDEPITSPARAREMVESGAGRILNLKPGRVGGFVSSRAIHDLCAAHGIAVWCGGMLESGIGRGHNIALASLPNFSLPGDLSPSRRYWQHDIVWPEWEMDANGMVQVPWDRPGIGVEVDVERVEHLTVRAEVLGGTT